MGRTSSPADVRDFLVEPEWWVVDNFVGWTSVVTGDGAATRAPRVSQVDTTASAGASTAILRTGNTVGWSLDKDHRILNWSKPIIIDFFASMQASTTNGIARVTLGKATGDGIGILVDRGIGWVWEELVVSGHEHNGSFATNVDLSTTISENVVDRYTVTWDGTGGVEWFINGASVGTSTAGPLGGGDSDSAENLFQIEVDDGTDADAQTLTLHNLRIFIAD